MGDETKLAKFLELNPAIPRDSVFVDNLNLAVYDKLQLKKFTDANHPDELKQVQLQKPDHMGGFQGWWKYLTNVIALSPIDDKDNNKLGGIPEGVLRLGATFVVQGDDIVYQWNDKLPGDHPDPASVLDFAVKQQQAAGATSQS